MYYLTKQTMLCGMLLGVVTLTACSPKEAPKKTQTVKQNTESQEAPPMSALPADPTGVMSVEPEQSDEGDDTTHVDESDLKDDAQTDTQ